VRQGRVILLTGASGVVGRAIADELPDEHVIGLVHSDAADIPVAETIRCDLGQPRLGLSAELWRRLAARIDVIVHSAALTEWGQPADRHRAINVDGTRAVIELAQAAGAPIHFLSTAFVRALELGRGDELSDDNVVRAYITSKLEAERLLQASGVPNTIYRPTNLVGHSRTGASSRPQIVQHLSAWICRGKAPFIPAHPGNLIDVAPVDVCAIAVANAIRADDLGGLYWIAYGDDGMTVQETIDIAVEHASSRGREIKPPPIADPSGPLPIPLERIAPMSRRFLKIMIDVSEVTHASGGALPTSLPDLSRRLGVPIPSDRDAYRVSLEHWAGDASELTKGAI
jgi:nucleoside-diphosphate-sugar epimerase